MAAEEGGTTEGPCGAGNTRQRHGLAAPAGDVASSSCPDRVMPDGRKGSKKSGLHPAAVRYSSIHPWRRLSPKGPSMRSNSIAGIAGN
jgi:hypothetical protein